MKDEVKRISRLVAEGKLSAEDAADLIDAFYASERSEINEEREEARSETPPPPPQDAHRDPFKSLLDGLEKLTKEGVDSVNWQEVSKQARESAKKGFESIKTGVEEMSKGKIHLGWLTMTESKEVSLPLSIPVGKSLRIENPNGNIKIVGGFDVGTATATAKIKGATHEEAKQKALEYTLIIEETDHLILLKQPSQPGLVVDLDIQYPGVGAVEIRGESGNIQVMDTRDAARISVRSGNISLKGLNGVIEVNSGSGNVSIEDAESPSIVVENQSGNIDLSKVKGNVNARTASGNVHLTNGHGKVVSVESVSGDVSVDLDEPLNGNLSVRTMSGNAVVTLPDGGDYRVSASTLRGLVRCSVSLDNEAKSEQRITGMKGAGVGMLDISAVTGNVTVGLRDASA